MLSVRRKRNYVRRTLVSTVEVHIGSCWRISVSHDQAGQRRMSSCPTGTVVRRTATNSHQVHEHTELVDNAELDRKHKNCIFTISNQYRWKPDIATSWEMQQKYFFMSLSSLYMLIKVYVNFFILFISSCKCDKRCLSMPRTITENVVHSVEFLDLSSG